VREQGDPADHRPVHPAIPSIGIKELIMADRTEIHRRNRGYGHTLSFHLPTDKGLEIQPSLVTLIITYNRLPIRQSHSELVEYRIVYFIAAGTGRGSNTDSQI
jgi:superfamily II DNA/RNA helicase